MKMQRIHNHKQLRDVVIEQIRTMIARGELVPGQWLRQEQFATDLGTSDTPIREALKQLEIEGLVEHVPYKGMRVVEFSIQDVLDVYTMRSMLEGLAAFTSATLLTNEQLTHLRQLHEQMSRLIGPANFGEIRELNRQFHSLIFEASGRTYVIRTLQTVWTWFPTMLWNQFSEISANALAHREQADKTEHEQILTALEARDGAAAERYMCYHIEQSRLSLIQHLDDKQRDSIRHDKRDGDNS